MKQIRSDGSEEMSFSDGTRVEIGVNGEKTLHLANGEKEMHTAEYKVRAGAMSDDWIALHQPVLIFFREESILMGQSRFCSTTVARNRGTPTGGCEPGTKMATLYGT